MLSVYYFVRGNGTYACARAAKHALIDKKRKLFLRVYPLGIVAPATMQRTAFEKRRRANTRSVVNGKSFYCRDFCFFFHFYLLEKSFFVLSLVFDHIVGETRGLPFHNAAGASHPPYGIRSLLGTYIISIVGTGVRWLSDCGFRQKQVIEHK